jgi:hypothetical protein
VDQVGEQVANQGFVACAERTGQRRGGERDPAEGVEDQHGAHGAIDDGLEDFSAHSP